MGFTQTYEEVKSAPTGAGGDYLRYFKDGDTTFRIIQEPSQWVGYWEHFNPGGFSFPCTQDRKTCPGCTSSNEKMKKAGRKIAIQVVQTVDGTEYVNVYKFPKTLADKLDNRFARIGTVTDRDYTITKFKSGDKVEYDIEGQDKSPVDVSAYELKNVEELLQKAYDDAWGENAKETTQRSEEEQATADLKAKLAAVKEKQEEPAPFESAPEGATDKVWTEEELRAMSLEQIRQVAADEGLGEPPAELTTTDAVVDWMLDQG